MRDVTSRDNKPDVTAIVIAVLALVITQYNLDLTFVEYAILDVLQKVQSFCATELI